jgi:CheY-specific phosphatase CheX
MPSRELIAEVVAATLARTRSYFEEEFGINVIDVSQNRGNIEMLAIHDLTAIVGVGGTVNLLVAFSFEQTLVDALYDRMTADIEVPPGEEELYRGSAAAEIVNTIIGNCTADFQQRDHGISLTPPVILDTAKHIQRMKNAVFMSRALDTEFGRVDINLVGPTELFDVNLDYVK